MSDDQLRAADRMYTNRTGRYTLVKWKCTHRTYSHRQSTGRRGCSAVAESRAATENSLDAQVDGVGHQCASRIGGRGRAVGAPRREMSRRCTNFPGRPATRRRVSARTPFSPPSLSIHGQSLATKTESPGFIGSHTRSSRRAGAHIHELHALVDTVAIPPGAVFVGGEIAANPGPLVSQRTRGTRRKVQSLACGSRT